MYDGWRYPDDWITEAYALEGPKLFRRDGLVLPGQRGRRHRRARPTGHMVIVARSRSVHGPWENSPHNPIARTRDAAERWWSRGHATILQGPADAWWMVSHGYEHGFRTLGRQVLLEPIAWTDDGWPVAAAVDIGVAAAVTGGCRAAARVAGLPRRLRVRPPRRAVDLPRADSPGEADRLRVDDGLVLTREGERPGRHLAALHPHRRPLLRGRGRHRVSESGSTEAGLLLFFNNRLFCGMGIDGERMLSYSGGIRTHWREPAAPARRMTLRIRNDEHIVTGWYRLPGERLGAARRAVRDIRVPREHDGRPPEPPPGDLRGG